MDKIINNEAYNLTMDEIVLSIVIPIFNRNNSIVRTLNSVKQIINKNIEIICVDDGSTDNTYQTLIDYFDKHMTIKHKIIRTDNQGVMLARYNGTTIAEGEFIMYIDCGDLISRPAFQIIFNKIISTRGDYDGYFYDYILIRNQTPKRVTSYVNDGINTKNLLLGKLPFSVWTKIFKKELLLNLDVYSYNKRIKNGEDLCVSFEVLSKNNNILYINQYPYLYYFDEFSSDNLKKDVTNVLVALDYLHEYINNYNLDCKSELAQLMYEKTIPFIKKSHCNDDSKPLLDFAKKYLMFFANYLDASALDIVFEYIHK